MTLSMRLRRQLSFWGILLFAVIALALIMPRLPKPALASYYPVSTAVYAKEGELLRLTLAKDQQYRIWLPLSELPAHLRHATLLYEDRWFYRHYGINPIALLRSAWQTYGHGTRLGASTLTMQLARQLYHINSRRVWGKLWQCLAAISLELRYSKDELLAAYLNTAPYGGNISGIGAASLIYFHKPAAQLSVAEALSLAVIPQNPVRRAPKHQLPPALLAARQRLWQRWLSVYPQDRGLAADVLLPLKVYSLADKPFIAPHLTDSLLRHYPQDRHIVSSLQLGVQTAVKQQIDRFIVHQRSSGIRNAAALLVDTDSMQVAALVGSANYGNKSIAGQVNAITAKRSPGSALKPFIYALALDQGLIHPRSLLKDTPTRFGAYNPENFDGRFIGPVSAQEALIRSRNIPALTLAAQLHKPDLYEFLQLSGVSGLRSRDFYGLSLSLGSAEVSMQELAAMYALLANHGVLQALRYRTDDNVPQAKTALLSEAAAFITLDMLSQHARPDSLRPALPPVAWKTGTSWGYKDAWAVGVAGHYVLVVWVGNFDNAGNAAFVGIRSAAPLFFSLLDSLRAQSLLPGLELAFVRPATVTALDVCAASGDLPNPECPALAKTWFIPGKSPIKISTLHRAVYVDDRTGRVVCKAAPHSHKEVYEFWPSDLYPLFKAAGMPRRTPPPLPTCYNASSQSAAVTISAPSALATYSLRISKPSSIALRAETIGETELFWFANKSYLGKRLASETLWWQPKRAGQYQIRAVDALGHADVREISVEILP
ncbi:MAG: penicillin-binding protein 1C [Methylococcaceae bacterium]|nr:penicillin-binding protein 1C [Methylococcaceae bacterium]